MGKHRDVWAREIIARLVLLGRQLSLHLPIQVETEHKVHRGFIDVAWYVRTPSAREKLYISIFEIETSKSDWSRIRNNAAKIVSLNPLVVFHIFKPGVRLKKEEREELIKIHHGRKAYVVNTEKMMDSMMNNLATAFSRRKGLTGRTRVFHLPAIYIDTLDKFVEAGLYETRAEAFRIAINRLLADELYGISVNRFKKCSLCGSYRVYFDFEDRKSICLKCGKIRSVC